jgi:diketogulonate reductase-like aldo/keto reductase
VRNQKADDPTLAKIAKKHGKETTQVLIRWSLQKGCVLAPWAMRSEIAGSFIPLPKSDTPARIKAK